MSYSKQSLSLHKQHKGKLAVVSKVPVENREDLSLAYTPGVAEPCRVIAEEPAKANDLTMKGNTVAVVSDGSAVLGMGNIGPEAAIPVMEGKAVLFKQFGGVDAFPIVLNTQNTQEIIDTVVAIAPTFGGINLEDISAPRCFEIEQKLNELLPIPVFHDDQHGTAIVVLAGIINALKITGKKKEEVEVVVNGVGAAGVAITKLLMTWGIKDLLLVDSHGVIYEGRDHLNPVKQELAKITNRDNIHGSLEEAMKGRDIFIGVSVANVLSTDIVQTMNPDPIIFAMANPNPEIMPDAARAGGARIVATGRSDFPNQINNVLVFPGIFKGALQARIQEITIDMKIAAAQALADLVADPHEEKIIPDPFRPGVANAVAQSVLDYSND